MDLKRVNGQVFNLGTGCELDIITVAKRVLQLLGKPETLISHVSERPGQVARHWAQTRKAEDVLGWKAAVSFDEGLQRTVAWYLANPEWWREQVWMETVKVRNKAGVVDYH
jgi:dTDP-glucose 4,6-dehydratase